MFGLLPVSSRGNRFILVVNDHFSKWIEIVALSYITSANVIKFFETVILSRFGISKIIFSDNRIIFVLYEFRNRCLSLGIDKR